MELPTQPTFRNSLLVLLLIALAIRLVAAVVVEPPLLSDDREYVLLADTLLESGSYAIDGVPTAYRPPGYPFFIASVFAVFGHSIRALMIVQAILDTLTCLFVFRLAERHLPMNYAIGAVAVYGLFPLQVLYSATILSETVFTFLFLGSVTILSERDTSGAWLLAGGILTGLAVLVRPVALLLPVVLVFAPTLTAGAPAIRLRNAAIIVAGLMIVIAPWTIRNTLELERPLITTNTGVNFWIGNHDGANGSFSYPEDNPLTRIDDEVERSSEGMRRGLAYWMTKPLGAGTVIVRKFAYMFSIDYWVLLSHHGLAESSDGPHAVEMYRIIPAWSIIVTHLPTMIICLLTVVSLCGVPQAERKEWFFLTALLVGWIALHLVFFGSARYRVPMHPILAVTAIHGWSLLRARTFIITPNRALVAGSLIVLLLAGWSTEAYLLLFR